MGSSGSVLEKKRLNMNLHYFALFLLLVLTVNGAPKPDPKPSPKAAPKPIPKAAPKPIPKAAPKAGPNPMPKPAAKAKAQMAIIFNNKRHGGTGIPGMPGMTPMEYGYEYGGYDDYNEYGDYGFGEDAGNGKMYDMMIMDSYVNGGNGGMGMETRRMK